MSTIRQTLEYYLTTVPSRKVEHEETDDGRVVLLQPRKLGGAFKKLLGPRLPKKFERIKLDDIGTAVWNLMDGERTVGQIAKDAEKSLGESLDQRNDRVALFVSTMHRNGMITLLGQATIEED